MRTERFTPTPIETATPRAAVVALVSAVHAVGSPHAHARELRRRPASPVKGTRLAVALEGASS